MSEALSTLHAGRTESSRGQTLVEFGLVLPMLLILLLGIADFGRVFSAGITIEAAARNAAEAAAQEYLQLRRDSSPITGDQFDRVAAVALERLCADADPLPNQAAVGLICAMPAAGVCVHDQASELANYGSRCGAGAGAAPASCTMLHESWASTAPGTGQLPWVEVRACYRFTTLIDLTDVNLPFGWGLSLGEIWLQRDRSFTVADY
jgi:TadE-like protein